MIANFAPTQAPFTVSKYYHFLFSLPCQSRTLSTNIKIVRMCTIFGFTLSCPWIEMNNRSSNGLFYHTITWAFPFQNKSLLSATHITINQRTLDIYCLMFSCLLSKRYTRIYMFAVMAREGARFASFYRVIYRRLLLALCLLRLSNESHTTFARPRDRPPFKLI